MPSVRIMAWLSKLVRTLPAEVGIGRIEVWMCRWQRWTSGSLGSDDGDQLA